MRIQRREFFTALVGAGAVWPVAARAQQAAVPRIGYLGSSSFEKTADALCSRSNEAWRTLATSRIATLPSNTAGRMTSTLIN